MTKFLTILLTVVVAFLYYMSFQNGDNTADLPMLKSKLHIDFDVPLKVTTGFIASLFLYFMSKNFTYIQGTVYALIMVLTAMFSAGLIWFIVWDNIVPDKFIKWLLVLSFGACSFYLCWPGNKKPDIYPVKKK